MRIKPNVLSVDCDTSSFFEREVLMAAIALANSGGGRIFLEGDKLFDKTLRPRLIDYISSNTLPALFPVIDILFPPNIWKITVKPTKNPVATYRGKTFALDPNFSPYRLFPPVTPKKDEAGEITLPEKTEELLDCKTALRVAKKLDNTKNYKGISAFPTDVLYTVFSAVCCERRILLPTAWGIILFGKDSEFERFCKNYGVEYSAFSAKREKISDLKIEKNIFKQREELYYELLRDNEYCRSFGDFYFVFSHAFYTALSFRDTLNPSPIRVFNRSGVVEITFKTDISEKKLVKEGASFSTDIGRVLFTTQELFFRRGARKTANELLKKAGFGEIILEKRKSFSKIVIDLKHKNC